MQIEIAQMSSTLLSIGGIVMGIGFGMTEFRQLDAATIQKAAQAVVEDATPILENTYKLDLFKGVVEEELHAIR